MNVTDRQRLQRKRQRAITSLRLCAWVNSLVTAPWNVIPVLLFAFVTVFVWNLKSRYLVFEPSNLVLKSVYQYAPSILFLLIAFLLFVAMLRALSTPRSANRFEDALLMIGLTACDGMPPTLIARTRVKDTNVYHFVFYSLGVSKGTWEQRKDEIEDALNLHIVGDILYGGKKGNNRNLVVITAVCGVGNRKDGVLYDDEL